MTDTTMINAILKFKRNNNQAAVRELLQRVAGVNAASEVGTDKVMAVIAACEGRTVPNAKAGLKPNFNDAAFVQGVYSKWNGGAAS